MSRLTSRQGRSVGAVVALVAVMIVGTFAVATPASAAGPRLKLSVLSSRADVVSGGDALIRVTVKGVEPRQVRVDVDGEDITGKLREGDRPNRLEALVTGLPEGDSTITAEAADDSGRPDRLVVTNHPAVGPIFSGPHQKPFICDTAHFKLAVGGTLGEPIDADCSVKTRVDYVYRNVHGEFRALPPDVTRPKDLAYTTTSTGENVPYIVRVETGTRDRGIYETSILHDPQTPEPDPWTRPDGWNERLVYKFGGGCPRGWYIQGRATAGVVDHGLLSRGYAVASSTLNVFGNSCNDLLAAESMSMVKERFVESYGRPAFTLGHGASGGAYQSHQIGDNYPGLVDGILVGASFPEVGFATIHTITDAWLLHRYFTETAPGRFTEEQQKAISGFGVWKTLPNLASAGRRIDPRVFCPAQLPVELRYHPQDNPDGARCDVYSHTVNVYGWDESGNAPRRPLDNVGIPYGLRALTRGDISVDDFLDLNDRIGGFDADANLIPERTEADLEATAIAYRTGRLLNGGGGLSRIPIVDYRDYQDDASGGDIHLRVHGFATRERLREANGRTDNHVMLTEERGHGGFNTDPATVAGRALSELDAWVTATAADSDPADSRLDRIARNRPQWLSDSCWTKGDAPQRIWEKQRPDTSGSRCAELYPVWPTPRLVAGGPLANDIVKCQVVDLGDTKVGARLTARQRDRAERVFPHGVCDWSRPGVEQQPLEGTWLKF
ncbi:DUF6351 family protein [Stackebrandtia nassauensis]|uniref:DUF6351 domain-containing protein n=1 Tax=Stackebrandtia nassauensis (strain DSM 44728 / CIP 108903 / NRRL B-16338 / NBRC 102104 / LLR-40K-21) TaxID=446470 RepID=D3QB24_STANL|nr:DUF6351 family protein [Stackebrandtia nassauensis]ADD40841.1 conserved hypothetical protein [Stackebrandtia nassauensis DSM 44728]